MENEKKLKTIYVEFLRGELSTLYSPITFIEYLRSWKYKSAYWLRDIMNDCGFETSEDFYNSLALVEYEYDANIETQVQIRLDERKRAFDIAIEFYKEKMKSFESKTNAGYSLAFIDEDIAEECRHVANAISGGNALSAALGETMEDRIRKEVKIQVLTQ